DLATKVGNHPALLSTAQKLPPISLALRREADAVHHHATGAVLVGLLQYCLELGRGHGGSGHWASTQYALHTGDRLIKPRRCNDSTVTPATYRYGSPSLLLHSIHTPSGEYNNSHPALSRSTTSC